MMKFGSTPRLDATSALTLGAATIFKAGLDISFGKEPSAALSEASQKVTNSLFESLTSPDSQRPWDILRKL